MNIAYEVNFDGLIGPTHNYAGLSYGNIASMVNEQALSHPRQAALQGLEKMATLMRLGLKQAILPPHERPFLPVLRHLGFQGSDQQLLKQVQQENPKLLLASCSAAAMWTANAATTAPSVDSLDRRVHFTPANLITKFHRSFEVQTSALVLKRIFNHPLFNHHPPLPPHSHYADEGAANHTRFCREFGGPGVQLFVYGRRVDGEGQQPKKFPARQTDEAAKALARLHRLSKDGLIFAQQHPDAIDAGVFHNDVVSVGHQNVFLYHEKAFIETPRIIEQLQAKVQSICNTSLYPIPVAEEIIPLNEAVKTYLFNSQIVTLPEGNMAMIAPQECRESESVYTFLEQMIHQPDNPIKKVIYQDLRQSMQNGGGPACLRLRVILNEQELSETLPSIFLNEQLYQRLQGWITKHYRESLSIEDLSDPQLLIESRRALDDLTAILELGAIYPFQFQRLRQ